jgi:hypothetical protein
LAWCAIVLFGPIGLVPILTRQEGVPNIEETPMRKSLARKLILSTAITSLIAIPAAFAHGHHGGSSSGNSSHRFGHHGTHSRSDSHSQPALATHKHDRVPDEEEVGQPE